MGGAQRAHPAFSPSLLSSKAPPPFSWSADLSQYPCLGPGGFCMCLTRDSEALTLPLAPAAAFARLTPSSSMSPRSGFWLLPCVCRPRSAAEVPLLFARRVQILV